MQTAVRNCACRQIAAQPASLCSDFGFDLWQRFLDHGYIDYDPPQQLSHHNYTLRASGPLSYDPAFKLGHHDYKLRGHGYDVVYPNDISPDDDNGEA